MTTNSMFETGLAPKQLLEEHGDQAREVFDKNQIGKTGLHIAPMEMKHIELDWFLLEFLTKGDNLILHFFTKEGYYWPETFRSYIWNAAMEQFRLQSREDQLVIEWVQELYSWCVTIKNIAVVSPPDDEDIVSFVQKITEAFNAAQTNQVLNDG